MTVIYSILTGYYRIENKIQSLKNSLCPPPTYTIYFSFYVAQLLSPVWLFAIPWNAA